MYFSIMLFLFSSISLSIIVDLKKYRDTEIFLIPARTLSPIFSSDIVTVFPPATVTLDEEGKQAGGGGGSGGGVVVVVVVVVVVGRVGSLVVGVVVESERLTLKHPMQQGVLRSGSGHGVPQFSHESSTVDTLQHIEP